MRANVADDGLGIHRKPAAVSVRGTVGIRNIARLKRFLNISTKPDGMLCSAHGAVKI